MKTRLTELWNATNKRVLFMFFLMALILVVFNALSGGFILRAENFANLIRQVTVVAILAVGMTLIIVMGHIDLSVGSALGMFGAVTASMIAQLNVDPILAVTIVNIAGFLIGCLHGALVYYLNIPAFVVTLGGLIAYRGVTQYVARQSIPVRTEWIKAIAQDFTPDYLSYTILTIIVIVPVVLTFVNRSRLRKAELPVYTPLWIETVKLAVIALIAISVIVTLIQGGGIPVQAIILLIAGVIITFISKNTPFGHYVYAIGGNSQAARYSGISISKNTILVFGLMTMLTAICGIITISELSAAAPDIGDLKELEAIAACVIGGASLAGGSGAIGMSILGALIMASIKNGMSMMGVVAQTQKIVLGTVLVFAVALDQWSRRGKSR
ncbi:MAG: sugar ABC transporter permease [Fibrobacter sp.]|nr:sugar ABC transporter permease [Fibrobacter sp.]